MCPKRLSQGYLRIRATDGGQLTVCVCSLFFTPSTTQHCHGENMCERSVHKHFKSQCSCLLRQSKTQRKIPNSDFIMPRFHLAPLSKFTHCVYLNLDCYAGVTDEFYYIYLRAIHLSANCFSHVQTVYFRYKP